MRLISYYKLKNAEVLNYSNNGIRNLRKQTKGYSRSRTMRLRIVLREQKKLKTYLGVKAWSVRCGWSKELRKFCVSEFLRFQERERERRKLLFGTGQGTVSWPFPFSKWPRLSPNPKMFVDWLRPAKLLSYFLFYFLRNLELLFFFFFLFLRRT